MKKCILFFITSLYLSIAFGQNESIAKRLGYSSDAKLLILHADDLGMAHSENIASIYGLENSLVNSASIMVPCPWFPEIADYASKNTKVDFGLHLTLTSEWKYYKWSPVTSKDSVKGLVNKNGYFYSQVDSLVSKANKNEVFLELSNQVKKALTAGIDVTHLDTHMRAAMGSINLLEAYIKVGKKYNLPVFLHKNLKALNNPIIQKLLEENDIIIDYTHTASPKDFKEGMALYYTKVLNNLKPGLNNLLIHLAYDNEEMRGITIDHPNWGSVWRQADFDFFNSKDCEDLIKKNNIILVTWRELRELNLKTSKE